MSFNYSGSVKLSYADNASLLLGHDFWYLLEDVKIDFVLNNDHYEVNIPKGYLTDGASVPRLFWNVFPQWDNTSKAVVLHDYLCEYGIARINGCEKIVPRIMVDKIFLEALRFEGITKIKYNIMYAAVRMHSNIHHLDKPRIDPLKFNCEEEIKLNLAKGYYS